MYRKEYPIECCGILESVSFKESLRPISLKGVVLGVSWQEVRSSRSPGPNYSDLRDLGAKNDDHDNGGYIKTVERNDGSGQENRKSWTNLQRQTFVQGCATTAQQQQGFTAQQANSYCDCMTRKVEKKYSFDQAARLKAADLQTQEWIDAATDCRSGN